MIKMKSGSKDLEKNIFFNTSRRAWECGICRKCFKEKKDIEQHLSSSTHGALRFSCAECGKGFASLGALTLHIEQAGHVEKNKKLLKDVELVALGLKDAEELVSVDLISRNPAIVSPSRRLHVPMNSNVANDYNIVLSSPFRHPSPYQSEISCSVWISGYSNFRNLIGAGCYSITNDVTRANICQESFAVHQYCCGSIQPEYESLCRSMAKALDMKLSNIRIKTSNELLYLHFTKGSSSFGYTQYYTVEHLVKQAQQLFTKFYRVEIDHVPSSATKHLNQQAYETATQYMSQSTMGLPSLPRPPLQPNFPTTVFSSQHFHNTSHQYGYNPLNRNSYDSLVQNTSSDGSFKTVMTSPQTDTFNTLEYKNNRTFNTYSIATNESTMNITTNNNKMKGDLYPSPSVFPSGHLKPFRNINIFDMESIKYDSYTPLTSTTMSSSPSHITSHYTHTL